MPSYVPVERRFWSKVRVSKRGCWLWTGGKVGKGYGKFQIPKEPGQLQKAIRAHRFSFLLSHGEIDEKLDVLHSCDTPACVRPSHLRQGTDVENTADKVSRARQHHPTGEKNGRAVLKQVDVDAIRLSKLSAKELSLAYGVTPVTIRLIRRGERW